jgi:hypothetical protein
LKPYIGPKEIYGDKAFSFEGTQKIHFTCKEPTNEIIFHSLDLKLNASSLLLESTTDSSGLKALSNVRYDSKRDFALIQMSGLCKKDSNYILTVGFTGMLREITNGFYRSTYKDANGNIKQ